MHNNPLLKAEYGKIHAKLHKQISDALPCEDEDTREALKSLAIVRKYALKVDDRLTESEIWLSLQSRYVELPFFLYA